MALGHFPPRTLKHQLRFQFAGGTRAERSWYAFQKLLWNEHFCEAAISGIIDVLV
jgi:hypothetical protein